MERCSNCDMPIDEKTRCSCKPSVCYHCCSCPPDCGCGCHQRDEEESKEEESKEE